MTEENRELSDLKLDERNVKNVVPSGLTVSMFFVVLVISTLTVVDLAGLVCNNYGDGRCINPRKDQQVVRPGNIDLDTLME